MRSRIIDTPDFFWKEKSFETDYKMVCVLRKYSSCVNSFLLNVGEQLLGDVGQN